jgi:hypothetical protein
VVRLTWDWNQTNYIGCNKVDTVMKQHWSDTSLFLTITWILHNKFILDILGKDWHLKCQHPATWTLLSQWTPHSQSFLIRQSSKTNANTPETLVAQTVLRKTQTNQQPKDGSRTMLVTDPNEASKTFPYLATSCTDSRQLNAATMP